MEDPIQWFNKVKRNVHNAVKSAKDINYKTFMDNPVAYEISLTGRASYIGKIDKELEKAKKDANKAEVGYLNSHGLGRIPETIHKPYDDTIYVDGLKVKIPESPKKPAKLSLQYYRAAMIGSGEAGFFD